MDSLTPKEPTGAASKTKEKKLETTTKEAPWSPGHLHGRANRTKWKSQPTRILPNDDITTYNRFYILESEEEDKSLKRKSFETYNDLIKECQGEPETISILRNGTILLKAKNGEQSKNIEKIKRVAGTKVKVAPHRKLNSSQGTVLAEGFDEYTESELCENLANKGVTQVIKLPSRPNQRYRGTRYLLTFNRPQPPEQIRAGMEKLSVRLYVPRPRRCYNCQGFGHVGKHCKREVGTCANCSEPMHISLEETCQKNPKCRNCSGDHPASDGRCPIYRMEQEIITIVTKEKTSFQEARKRVRAQYPDRGRSYAEVARNRRESNSNVNRLEMPTRLNFNRSRDEYLPPKAGNSQKVTSPRKSPQSLPNQREHTHDKRKASPHESSNERKKIHNTPTHHTKAVEEEADNTPANKETLSPVKQPENPPKQQGYKSLTKDYHMPPGYKSPGTTGKSIQNRESNPPLPKGQVSTTKHNTTPQPIKRNEYTTERDPRKKQIPKNSIYSKK